MKSIKNKSNCFFTYSVTAELFFILIRIFDKNNGHNLGSIYSEDFIEAMQRDYRFLGEIIPSLPLKGYGVLEFLLENKSFNDVDAYKQHVMSLEDVEFFFYFYGQFWERETLHKALSDEKELSRLYEREERLCSSYLALKSLFNNKMQFVEELFSCIERLDTIEFRKAFSEISTRLLSEAEVIENALQEAEPMDFSQRLMGKIFRNRGPYENFIFVPSYFIQGKAIRYFGKDQILVYSINHKQFTRDDLVKILKVISDEKRFEIITLLSENGSLMGKELAEKLDLAKATVSHHIEQLKETGFINEERVKNSKYYSINPRGVDKFIGYLSEILKK